jgi:hypothetical protein
MSGCSSARRSPKGRGWACSYGVMPYLSTPDHRSGGSVRRCRRWLVRFVSLGLQRRARGARGQSCLAWATMEAVDPPRPYGNVWHLKGRPGKDKSRDPIRRRVRGVQCRLGTSRVTKQDSRPSQTDRSHSAMTAATSLRTGAHGRGR